MIVTVQPIALKAVLALIYKELDCEFHRTPAGPVTATELPCGSIDLRFKKKLSNCFG